MKSLKTLIGIALATTTLGGAIAVGAASNSSVSLEPAAAASTTKNEDATGIAYLDKQGWCFRTLHMYSVTYVSGSGYTSTDFESFLTGFYGAKINSWSNQGTTRGWGLNGGTAGDYMICDGGTQTNHSFVFPWWVQGFKFQIVNNGNWLCNWEVKSDWGYHTNLDLTVDGTTVTNNSMNAFTYDFPAVTITKSAVNSSTKQVIAGISISSETTSIYDKYPNGSSTPGDPTILNNGFVFNGWYSNQALSTAFTKKYYTSDATIYAKYEPVQNKSVYVDAYTWSNLYLYVYETVGGHLVEYNGIFPGAKITINDSNLRFNNGMLQKIDVPYVTQANVRFIYSDGTNNNKSNDLSLTEGAYYWHNGTAWVTDSTHYASAAAFVYDLNSTRLQVTASGSIKAYSICGLTAKTWVDRYDGLNETAKGYVDAATMFTYRNASSTGADETVTFASVMTTLRSRYSMPLSSNIVLSNNKTSSAVIIIVVSVIGVASVGAFFLFLRKRKHF